MKLTKTEENAKLLCDWIRKGLRIEPDAEACKDVSRTAGAGVSSVADALAKHGWKLEAVAEGKDSRAYSVTKI